MSGGQHRGRRYAARTFRRSISIGHEHQHANWAGVMFRRDKHHQSRNSPKQFHGIFLKAHGARKRQPVVMNLPGERKNPTKARLRRGIEKARRRGCSTGRCPLCKKGYEAKPELVRRGGLGNAARPALLQQSKNKEACDTQSAIVLGRIRRDVKAHWRGKRRSLGGCEHW